MGGEDLIIKYGFTYGPLMLFYLAMGYVAWKWGPPAFQTITATFKELIAALNSSTAALQNSTSALAANNEAMKNHHDTVEGLRQMWDEMRQRIDNFNCPHSPQPNIVTLVQKQKTRQANSN